MQPFIINCSHTTNILQNPIETKICFYYLVDGFQLRSVGRRIVMGLVVDHELEMTEIRVRQLRNLVDVFVLLESNVTAGKSSLTLTEDKVNSEKLKL